MELMDPPQEEQVRNGKSNNWSKAGQRVRRQKAASRRAATGGRELRSDGQRRRWCGAGGGSGPGRVWLHASHTTTATFSLTAEGWKGELALERHPGYVATHQQRLSSQKKGRELSRAKHSNPALLSNQFEGCRHGNTLRWSSQHHSTAPHSTRKRRRRRRQCCEHGLVEETRRRHESLAHLLALRDAAAPIPLWASRWTAASGSQWGKSGSCTWRLAGEHVGFCAESF